MYLYQPTYQTPIVWVFQPFKAFPLPLSPPPQQSHPEHHYYLNPPAQHHGKLEMFLLINFIYTWNFLLL